MDGENPVRSDVAGMLRARLSQRPPAGVVSVYLFGSHAGGRAHRESDVDLGVLLRWDVYPTDQARFEARLRLIAELALGRMPIDVVILNDAPPTLAARIAAEGQRLFCADAEADHAFRRDAQLRAADLAPFLRRMARVKLEALGGDVPR
jgi:predicted nucleotidyltransferase